MCTYLAVAIKMTTAADLEEVNLLASGEYSVHYTGSGSMTLDQVYWGTTDVGAVTNTIYDAYDGTYLVVVVQA